MHNKQLAIIRFLAQLAGYVKMLGLMTFFTNHSLRTSAATRLYDAGVDEQLIMLQTGHRSTAGVRSYKRTSNALKTA